MDKSKNLVMSDKKMIEKLHKLLDDVIKMHKSKDVSYLAFWTLQEHCASLMSEVTLTEYNNG